VRQLLFSLTAFDYFDDPISQVIRVIDYHVASKKSAIEQKGLFDGLGAYEPAHAGRRYTFSLSRHQYSYRGAASKKSIA
jgi:hypothetical protein